jgi:hypothetical protein
MASGTFMITQGPCPLADLIPRRVAHHHRKSQQLISDFAGALHHHLHYPTRKDLSGSEKTRLRWVGQVQQSRKLDSP